MKSLTQFIIESSQNSVIKDITKEIDSCNGKKQRAKNEDAEAWMNSLKKEFEKIGAKKAKSIPTPKELQTGTWLIYSANSMVLGHWDYNHFITWTIQAKENGVDGQAVVCGSIYYNSTELDKFLSSQMGEGKLTFLLVNKDLV